jgi:hypothetical protein
MVLLIVTVFRITANREDIRNLMSRLETALEANNYSHKDEQRRELSFRNVGNIVQRVSPKYCCCRAGN